MRLTYIGNFRPSHSTENHIADTFAELGWTVAKVQQDEADRRWPRVVNEAMRSDLVLYTRTHSWGDPIHAMSLWQQCAEKGIRTATFHLDLFIGIERERDVRRRHAPFHTGTVFTPDGDHDRQWEVYGVNHQYLRAGVYREEAKPGARDPHYEPFDVAFIGSSHGYHREWDYRQRLLGWLAGQYGDRFLLAPRRGQPAVRGQALNDLYATVPVIVGDSLCIYKEHSTYWSDRVYETIGRGGFLVMPRIDALQRELETVESVAWYEWGDFDGLRVVIDGLLDTFQQDPNARALAVAQGSAWVRDHASYRNRVIEMLDVLGLSYCEPVLAR